MLPPTATTPNLPASIIPTTIARLKLSRRFPMDVRLPPLNIDIMLETNPLKSRILVRGLAVHLLLLLLLLLPPLLLLLLLLLLHDFVVERVMSPSGPPGASSLGPFLLGFSFSFLSICFHYFPGSFCSFKLIVRLFLVFINEFTMFMVF